MRKYISRTRNISTLLSINSFIPLMFTVLVFSLSFYFYTSQILIERGKESLMQLSDQLTENLEAELKKMSTLALNISYSMRLKEELEEHISLYSSDPTQINQRDAYLNTGSMIRIIGEITGPYKTVPQVNVIIPELHNVSTGMYNLIQPTSHETISMLSPYNIEAGALYYSSLHWDRRVQETLEDSEKVLFVSLYKTIFDNYHKPLAILEIKQFADTLFANFNRPEEQILVFDGKGTQIYPATVPMGSIYASMAVRENKDSIQNFINPLSGRQEILAVTESLETGWIVLTVTDRNRYLTPVYRFIGVIVIISLIILAVGFLISIILSRKITMPLKDLNQKISRLDWMDAASSQSQQNQHAMQSSLIEVNELHLTFQAMNKKLDATLSHMVAEKTLETQSRLLALQSQMDPHFIYNMLTTLSIMAEEGETSEIMKTVTHMTRILRYISDGSQIQSTLQEEKNIVMHYISCMKIRFGENLRFSAEIPQEMESIIIPRHILLPLVENAVKYGMTGNPPWFIGLEAHMTDSSWEVILRDNGPGFSAESLKKLQYDMEQCRTNKGKQLDFHINGMGLINLYSRLLINYGDDLIFTVRNLPSKLENNGIVTQSGSIIRIGGHLA